MFRRIFCRAASKKQTDECASMLDADVTSPPPYTTTCTSTGSPDDHIHKALVILGNSGSGPDCLVPWLDGLVASTPYKMACLAVWHRYVATYVVAWHNNTIPSDIKKARDLIFNRASYVMDRKVAAKYMLATVSDDGGSDRQVALRNVYYGYAAQIIIACHSRTNVHLDDAVVDRIAAEEADAARYAADQAAIAAVKAATALAVRVALKAEIEAAVSDVSDSNVGEFVGDSDSLQAAINAAQPDTTICMFVRRGDNNRFNLQIGEYSSDLNIRSTHMSDHCKKRNVFFKRLNGRECKTMSHDEIRNTIACAPNIVCIECWIPRSACRSRIIWWKKM